jgi:hypothetical protein
MANVLIVPVRLDALVLDQETAVVEAAADFSRLPYADPLDGRDRHADSPYLSERILPIPFQDEMRLKPGVHLHWSLPDALTRLVQDGEGGTRVPVVPNRWLVTRAGPGVTDRRWVVESDYLAPIGDDGDGVPFPVDGPVPFRRLGRTIPFDLWRPDDPADRLPELTAVGYGEPAFAALYSNCRGVFGLYDPDPPAPGTFYDVLGWYADPAQDPVAGLPAEGWVDALRDGFRWNVPESSPRPVRLVCYARLTLPATARNVPRSEGVDAETTGVYVGVTATEALAAHLGSVLPGDTPDQVENLLEALAFADELEAHPLDVGVRLAEQRQRAGFRPVPTGTLWTVRPDNDPAADAAQRQRREALTLPHRIGDLLDALNTAQAARDRAGAVLIHLRERLFADWYRYLLCAYPYETRRDTYPDPDLVRHYLERQLAALAERTAEAAVLDDELERAKANLDEALDTFDQAHAVASGTVFVADTVAAPAYYQPAEPVVLLTGDAARPSDRYGRDGTLGCAVLDLPALTAPDAVREALAAQDTVGELGANLWRDDLWHPVLMQWEVEFFPTAAGGNVDSREGAYDPAYITGNYELSEVDLAPRPDRQVYGKAANVYQGHTVLTAGARPVLSRRVLRYLAGAILDPYRDATSAGVTAREFQDVPEQVLTWYEEHGTDPRLLTLVRIYRHLAAHESDNSLSQALGGLNDALLMRRLTRQLPIADPLGFPGYQEFAARVAEAVGDATRHAPHPLSDFNPIRAGALRIRRLRIVDNFGRARDVDTDNVVTTTRLRVPGLPGWVAMPPRLAQPARLSARWLDSDHELRHMNDVPVTSPVCGWLLPDDLDAGVGVHDAAGRPLGLLSAVPDPGEPGLARWSPAPGGPVRTVEDIADPHLRGVVTWLRALGPDELAGWVARLDDTLAGIEPADHRPGVLTARPLAVARAEIGLELIGLPAIHQDWNVFRQDLGRTSREDDDFPLVRFPVRIGGGGGRLNDGLAGLWDGGTFRAGAAEVEVAVALPPHRLTLLVDPRAPVHLTCGILPAKALEIPPEQYRPAMDGMRVTFLTAPVLTGGDTVALPVPGEAGHGWEWRTRGPTGWTDVPVVDAPPDATFPDRPVLREGWLTLVPDDPGSTPGP